MSATLTHDDDLRSGARAHVRPSSFAASQPPPAQAQHSSLTPPAVSTGKQPGSSHAAEGTTAQLPQARETRDGRMYWTPAGVPTHAHSTVVPGVAMRFWSAAGLAETDVMTAEQYAEVSALIASALTIMGSQHASGARACETLPLESMRRGARALDAADGLRAAQLCTSVIEATAECTRSENELELVASLARLHQHVTAVDDADCGALRVALRQCAAIKGGARSWAELQRRLRTVAVLRSAKRVYVRTVGHVRERAEAEAAAYDEMRAEEDASLSEENTRMCAEQRAQVEAARVQAQVDIVTALSHARAAPSRAGPGSPAAELVGGAEEEEAAEEDAAEGGPQLFAELQRAHHGLPGARAALGAAIGSAIDAGVPVDGAEMRLALDLMLRATSRENLVSALVLGAAPAGAAPAAQSVTDVVAECGGKKKSSLGGDRLLRAALEDAVAAGVLPNATERARVQLLRRRCRAARRHAAAATTRMARSAMMTEAEKGGDALGGASPAVLPVPGAPKPSPWRPASLVSALSDLEAGSANSDD